PEPPPTTVIPSSLSSLKRSLSGSSLPEIFTFTSGHLFLFYQDLRLKTTRRKNNIKNRKLHCLPQPLFIPFVTILFIYIISLPNLLGSHPFTVLPLSTSTTTLLPSIFFPSACL